MLRFEDGWNRNTQDIKTLSLSSLAVHCNISHVLCLSFFFSRFLSLPLSLSLALPLLHRHAHALPNHEPPSGQQQLHLMRQAM